MLRAGVLTGGWASQSKRLAVTVIEATDPTVPYICMYYKYGSTVVNSTGITDYARMDELIEADYLMEVLRHGDDGYRRNNAANNAAKHKHNIRTAGTEGGYIGVGDADNTLCREFVAAFTDTYTPSTKARHAALAALLDGPKVIPISI